MVNRPCKLTFRGVSLWFLLGLFVLVFCGCAPKTRIVLLPDPDGRLGQVSVSTQAGERILASAYEATEVTRNDKLPSKSVIMDEARVKDAFKDALESRPALPAHFLLYFNSGTNDLTEDSLGLIPEVIQTVEKRRSTSIGVVGHTDRVGAAAYNQKLSLVRAEAIAALLVSKGVNPDIIEITSHGEENPVVKTADGVAEPKNRRVEITVR